MILLTGSNGFLGSAVAKQLVEQTEERIVCLVRPSSSISRLEPLLEDGRCEIRRGTLTSSKAAAEAIEGASTIYHLAAGMGGGAMADVWLSTVVGTRNLMDAVAANSATIDRFVHCSSFSVYGVNEMEAGAVVDEDTPLEPHPEKRDNYAFAKWRQEELVRDALADLAIELVIVRPGVVYGPGGNAISGRAGLKQGGLMVKMGRNNPMPLSYVDNCADAIVLVGQLPGTAGEVYNICDNDLRTVPEFIKQYRAEVGGLTVIPLPYAATKALGKTVSWYNRFSNGQLPAVITPYQVRNNWAGNTFSNAKLRSLGWVPRVSTDEGLRRHFAYLKAEAAG